jgi:exodeoxyribonuclease V beta subunit
VGDPKQSIYGFRSADLNSYMQLRRTVDERRRLSVSHRSDRRLVDAVNALFAVPAPFFHPEVLAEPVQSVFDTRRLRRDGFEDPSGLVLHAEPGQATVHECARLVASQVRALLGQGWMVRVKRDDPWRPLRPSDIAVLCRTNHELPRMAEALREARVPCVVLGSDNVFGSEMARDLAGALLAFARPSNRGLALAAAGTRLIGLSQHALASDPDGVVQRMRAAGAVFDRHGVVAGIREWMRSAGPGLDGLATEPDGERHLSDLAQLLELLDEAERSGIKGAPALASWMAEQVEGVRAGDDQVQRVRALAEHEAVTLQTVHGSKGLTYGIVWLPSAMQGAPVDRDEEAAREAAAESRRLLYVGLTRARWQAHALWRHDTEHAHAAMATLLHARGEVDAAQAAVASKARLGEKELAEVVKDLRAVAVASSGSIEVRELSAPVEGRPIETPTPLWREPLPPPRIPTAARQVSFTSLHDHLAEGDDSGQGTDRDDRGTQAPVEAGDPTPCDRALRDLGVRGIALGNLVHEALEQADVFAALAQADGPPVLARSLERGVLGANAPARALDAAAQIHASLGLTTPGVPSVSQVSARTRGVFRELKLAAGWRGGLQDLASAFEAEPYAWAAAFAQSLRGADRQRMHGLLVGNIDLAVLSEEGWFLYDYKTNDFGRGVGAYATARASGQLSPLEQGMIRSGYPLQAGLYATLVRRWARARGFIDQSAVAGVSYLFLRGMRPGLADHGIWHWKPSAAVLDAIDAHLVHAEVPE